MLFLGVLAYNDWITINWRKIDKDLISLIFRGTRAATGLTAYLKHMVTHFIPLAGGFYVGFQLAFGHRFGTV